MLFRLRPSEIYNDPVLVVQTCVESKVQQKFSEKHMTGESFILNRYGHTYVLWGSISDDTFVVPINV